jgi:hypothetical protein
MKSSNRTLSKVGNDQYWYLAEQLESLSLRPQLGLRSMYTPSATVRARFEPEFPARSEMLEMGEVRGLT